MRIETKRMEVVSVSSATRGVKGKLGGFILGSAVGKLLKGPASYDLRTDDLHSTRIHMFMELSISTG